MRFSTRFQAYAPRAPFGAGVSRLQAFVLRCQDAAIVPQPAQEFQPLVPRDDFLRFIDGQRRIYRISIDLLDMTWDDY